MGWSTHHRTRLCLCVLALVASACTLRLEKLQGADGAPHDGHIEGASGRDAPPAEARRGDQRAPDSPVAALACSPDPARGAHYVAPEGNDSNSGATPASPWKTIAHAAERVKAGETVHIKAGTYLKEEVVVANSGAPGSPIRFCGYRNAPGDVTSQGETIDPTAMPVLDGQKDAASVLSTAILLASKGYVEFYNLQLTNYRTGISVTGTLAAPSESIVIEQVLALRIGRRCTEPDATYFLCSAFHLDGVRTSTVRASIAAHCRHGFYLGHSSQCLLERIKALDAENDTAYYVLVQGGEGNTVRQSTVVKVAPSAQDKRPGKGIMVWDSSKNEIADCSVTGVAKAFHVAGSSSGNRIVRGTVIDGGLSARLAAAGLVDEGPGAFVVEAGASQNSFSGSAIGSRFGIWLSGAGDSNDDNLFANMILNGTGFSEAAGLRLDGGNNNRFESLVVDQTKYLFHFPSNSSNASGNTLKNSIVTHVTTLSSGTGSVTTTYSDFFANGFSTPVGSTLLSQDPLFAQASPPDYHLRSQHGRWTPSGLVKDSVTSPCIDAGDPSSDCTNEPEGPSCRIDLGAYGNTEEASKAKP